jgi:hypothetical protein
MNQAADEIERLERENAELRKDKARLDRIFEIVLREGWNGLTRRMNSRPALWNPMHPMDRETIDAALSPANPDSKP